MIGGNPITIVDLFPLKYIERETIKLRENNRICIAHKYTHLNMCFWSAQATLRITINFFYDQRFTISRFRGHCTRCVIISIGESLELKVESNKKRFSGEYWEIPHSANKIYINKTMRCHIIKEIEFPKGEYCNYGNQKFSFINLIGSYH